jgi:hypothetical protein
MDGLQTVELVKAITPLYNEMKGVMFHAQPTLPDLVTIQTPGVPRHTGAVWAISTLYLT